MKKLLYYAVWFYTLFILCMLAFSWYNMIDRSGWVQLTTNPLSFELMVFFSTVISVLWILVMKDEGWME